MEFTDWQPDPEAGPIYLQITRLIGEAIAGGQVIPGEKLPSARNLATLTGVNPNTVVHAYSELEARGISETRRGLGTFIRSDIDVAGLRHQILSEAAQVYLAKSQDLGISTQEAVQILEEVAGASRDV